MNTLDDLRASLDREAGRLDDVDRYVRPVAVRQRIRAVRRRRAALAACVAVLVVVAGTTAIASVLHGDDSVDPATRLFGVDVPDRVAVAGFPYELEDTAVLDGGGRTELKGGTADRAVSLVASGLGNGSATLYVDGEAVTRAFGDDAVELPVPVGAPLGTVRVQLHGAPADAHAGIAVYRATGDLAAGVSDGRVVFRAVRNGDRLLSGAFAAPGASSVTVTVRAALGELEFSDYCATDQKGLWINISVDGDGPMSSSCADDPGNTGDVSGVSSSFPGASQVAREHTVRAYVTRGDQGPEVSGEGVRLGVGVYERADAPRDVLGLGIDRTVEWGGRTWVLDRVVPGPSTGAPLATTLDTADGDLLIGFVASGGLVHVQWSGRLDEGRSVGIGAEDGPGSSLAGVLLEGDRYDVEMSSEDGTRFEGAVLVYRPV
jgi:hypothetical protein